MYLVLYTVGKVYDRKIEIQIKEDERRKKQNNCPCSIPEVHKHKKVRHMKAVRLKMTYSTKQC